MARREQIENGRKYGRLVVIAECGRLKNGSKKYLCQCECGEMCEKGKYYLLDTKMPSCTKCQNYGNESIKIMPGKKYNYLVALRPSENDKDKWWFRCERCGAYREMGFRPVLDGRSKACGCMRVGERTKEDKKKKTVKPFRKGDQFEYMTVEEIEAAKRVPKMGDINADAVEAQKQGMTYGKYMGLKIMEEIKRKKEGYV